MDASNLKRMSAQINVDDFLPASEEETQDQEFQTGMHPSPCGKPDRRLPHTIHFSSVLQL